MLFRSCLPNAWEQTYKLDPLIATGGNGPDGEVDGDGFSNLQEYLAGTDPTNSLSALRVTTITPTANDLHVSWTCVGGKNYVLQTNAVMIGSGFTDFSPVISVPGSGESTTNYTHAGAATLPRLFYRVRLEP